MGAHLPILALVSVMTLLKLLKAAAVSETQVLPAELLPRARDISHSPQEHPRGGAHSRLLRPWSGCGGRRGGLGALAKSSLPGDLAWPGTEWAGRPAGHRLRSRWLGRHHCPKRSLLSLALSPNVRQAPAWGTWLPFHNCDRPVEVRGRPHNVRKTVQRRPAQTLLRCHACGEAC